MGVLKQMPIFQYNSAKKEMQQRNMLILNPRQENVCDNMLLMQFDFAYVMECVWKKGFTKFYTGFMQEFTGPYVTNEISLRQFHLLFEHHRAKMHGANFPKLETFPKP